MLSNDWSHYYGPWSSINFSSVSGTCPRYDRLCLFTAWADRHLREIFCWLFKIASATVDDAFWKWKYKTFSLIQIRHNLLHKVGIAVYFSLTGLDSIPLKSTSKWQHTFLLGSIQTSKPWDQMYSDSSPYGECSHRMFTTLSAETTL